MRRRRWGDIYTTVGLQGPHLVCYVHLISIWHWSLGAHIDLSSPNVELHLPLGFIRIGVPSDRWYQLLRGERQRWMVRRLM